MTQRRVFLMTLATSGALIGTGVRAQATKVDEKEPQAVALAYVDDAAKAAASKQPKYAPGQVCANCALYQAKSAADPAGPCALFGGRLVAAKGWCTAWVKKA
jgi:phage I-like protein